MIVPTESTAFESVYHLFVIRIESQFRDGLRAFLEQRGVSTGIHYPIALPNLSAYAYLNHRPDDFPQATEASAEILSLPMFPELTEEQIAYVCESVELFLSSRSVPMSATVR